MKDSHWLSGHLLISRSLQSHDIRHKQPHLQRNQRPRLIVPTSQNLKHLTNHEHRTEADEIFQMPCEGASDLVPDENRGGFHFRLSSLVAAAHGCGLEKCKDIYQFSVIALVTSDEFYRASELDGSWARMRMGMDDFGSVVTSWPDETWNALMSIRAANSTDLSARGERHEPI
jgi:hypothetical protein